MNRLNTLREQFRAISAAFTCTRCGGSHMQRATSWGPRHGIGKHGVSTAEARSFEPAHPSRHCLCPGGPVWHTLANRPIGRAWKLDEAYRLWQRRGEPAEVYLVETDDAGKPAWFSMTLDQWRAMLTEQWETLLNWNEQAEARS